MRMPLKGKEWEARVVEEVTTLACLGCLLERWVAGVKILWPDIFQHFSLTIIVNFLCHESFLSLVQCMQIGSKDERLPFRRRAGLALTKRTGLSKTCLSF